MERNYPTTRRAEHSHGERPYGSPPLTRRSLRGRALTYAGESVTATVVIVLAIFGGSIAAVLEALQLSRPFPPAVAWVTCTVLILLAHAWIYYKIQTRLETLEEAIRSEVNLRPAQRERVFRIKENTGRLAFAVLRRQARDSELEALRDQLREDAAAILEHPAVSEIAAAAASNIDQFLSLIGNAKSAEERQHIISELTERTGEIHEQAIAACNKLLEEFPSPGTAV